MRRVFTSSKVVSPSSNLSVPRRELCSLVLGNKIGQKLAEELEVERDKVYLHSDSLIAMYWLQKEPRKLNTYVSNRIQKIREGVSKCFTPKQMKILPIFSRKLNQRLLI